MYTITVSANGSAFWLRSTVWTSERERAMTFDTVEAAQAQLNKAKQFMKNRVYKAARVVLA